MPPSQPSSRAEPAARRHGSVPANSRAIAQLGATYYLLESWGNDQQLYRFYCKMAVGGSADYTRYFEATDADPLQAMLGVSATGGGMAAKAPVGSKATGGTP